MLKHFYTEAPLPAMTKLAKCHPESPYLSQEVEMLLNSGLTQSFRSPRDQKLYGATLSAYWENDPKYKTFKVSAIEWLNTAAKVARDFSQTDAEIIAIFRDLTYQLIYHYGQCVAKQSGKSGVFYGASGFLDPNQRDSHIKLETAALNLTMLHKAALDHDSVLIMLGTRKTFLENMRYLLPYNYIVLDNVEYGSLDYRLSDGVNLMQGQPNSMTFLAASPYKLFSNM